MKNEGGKFVTESMLGLAGVPSNQVDGWNGVVVSRYYAPHDSFCRIEFADKKHAVLLNGITYYISRLVRPEVDLLIDHQGSASLDAFLAFYTESHDSVTVRRHEEYLRISTGRREVARLAKPFFKAVERACKNIGLRLASGSVRYGITTQKQLRINTAFDPAAWELWDGARRFANPQSSSQQFQDDLVRLGTSLEYSA